MSGTACDALKCTLRSRDDLALTDRLRKTLARNDHLILAETFDVNNIPVPNWNENLNISEVRVHERTFEGSIYTVEIFVNNFTATATSFIEISQITSINLAMRVGN